MKFSATVDVKAMLESVKRATSAINKSTIPVLSHVRLMAKGGRISVGGTNLDCWIESEFSAEQAAGAILVPGRQLESALSLLPPGAAASVTCDDVPLKITSGRARFEMPTLPAEDWPACAPLERPVTLTVAAKDFLAKCEALRPAIGIEQSRYYLTGILFDFENSRMVATNGHIMGWEPKCWAAEADAAPPRFTLPGDSMNPLRRLLEGLDECEMLIGEHGRRVMFRYDGQTITTKTIEGKYPQYEGVVPRSSEKVYRVGLADAMATLKRAASITDGRSSAVVFAFSDSELTMRARTSEGEAAEDTCGAELVSGKGDIITGAASKYVSWALESMPATAGVEFHLTDHATPLLLLPQGDTERQHVRVVMTMAVR